MFFKRQKTKHVLENSLCSAVKRKWKYEVVVFSVRYVVLRVWTKNPYATVINLKSGILDLAAEKINDENEHRFVAPYKLII